MPGRKPWRLHCNVPTQPTWDIPGHRDYHCFQNSIKRYPPHHHYGLHYQTHPKYSKSSLLAPTGALVSSDRSSCSRSLPLPLFHLTSSRSSKSLYNLLTLLKNLEHLCLYIWLPSQSDMLIDADWYMLVDTDWCWLMLSDHAWFWFLLIEAD